MHNFKDDFTFGVATAAFQIEGAYNEDGKTPSIWDTFCDKPGKVFNGDTGKIACDHYHRYKEDVKLLNYLGVDAYRFSISWARIFPKKGEFNPKGIEFYKNLISELKLNGIKPVVTLYHWDLPQWAEDLGGWLNRDCISWFDKYCNKIFDELGNSVFMWITHNEPFCASFLSYAFGEHAPGHKDTKEALIVAHHLLLSHGLAVKSFRKKKLNSKIGITLNLAPAYPYSNDEKDINIAKNSDGFLNRWFLDPVLKGFYPEDMIESYESKIGNLDFILPGDLETISEESDFLGINYYSRSVVKYNESFDNNFESVDIAKEKTAMGWEIYPEGLYNILNKIKNEYSNIPIYITENGAAFDDKVEENSVHDIKRKKYINEHLKQGLKFIENGGNLQGYFAWSFMDNFEWAHGYSKRFGLVHIDYDTQKRTLKDSALWYKDVIKNRKL
ncbi:MAG: GH1 family beta-glucosidase [Clostridiaceae bacterium]